MARKHAQPGKAEAAAERRVKALELRKAGKTYRVIGEALGVSEQQAWVDVKAALKTLAKREQDAARELRQLELERTEALIDAIWLKAKGRRYRDSDTDEIIEVEPDYKAIDRVIRLQQQRRALLGLDVQPDKDAAPDVTIRIVYGDGVDGRE